MSHYKDDTVVNLPTRWIHADLAADWLRRALFHCEVDSRKIRLILKDIYESSNFEYRLKEAIEWGKGFSFPRDIVHRDSAKLMESGTITKMTKRVHQEQRFHRLNVARVMFCVPEEDPDWDCLMDLCQGIRVFTESSFIPNSTTELPPLRKAYKEAHSAVDKLLFDLWRDELLFILPKNLVLQHEGCHFSPQHWAPKRGKQCGRPIHDASDEKYGSINSNEVSLMAENFYGKVSHPTIFSLVLMILEFEDKMRSSMGTLFNPDEVILFKNDLKRAFMLLNFRDDQVQLLCAELVDDLVALYHTGLFGLGTMPFAFAVISRVLERNLNKASLSFKQIMGMLKVYVDDLMSVTLKRYLEHDNGVVNLYCN